MPFAVKISWAGALSPAATGAMARSLAGRWPGRALKRTGEQAALVVHPDRFFEAPASGGDSLFTDPETGIQVALDARIDNETELAAQLDPGRTRSGRAELVLRAYRTYGASFARKLLGDFTIAVWDAPARRLVLAVDRVNLRQLYWRRHDGMVSVASELPTLLAEEFSPTLDLERAAYWFVRAGDPQLGHFYREIGQVPCGSIVVLDADGERAERYWAPEHAPDVRFRRSQDYLEACRELLTEAVRCRLPRRLEVGSHLSGGLDSPIVAGIASRVLGQQGRRLTTFTAGHQADGVARWWRGQYWDERANALAFARTLPNVDAVGVDIGECGLMDELDGFIQAVGMPPPVLNQVSFYGQIAREARKRKVGVILNGILGNQTISHPGRERLHTLFRRGRWLTLARQWRGLHARGHDPAYYLGWTFGPFLPEGMQRWLKGRVGRGALDRMALTPLAQSYRDDPARMARMAELHEVNHVFASLDLRRALSGLHRVNLGALASWFRQVFNLDPVSPYTDARVVEFCAGLPQDQFLGEGENRHLARRLLRDLGAPAALVSETRIGIQFASWPKQIAAARAEMQAELDMLETSPGARAVLDLPRLRDLITRDLPTEGLGRRQVYADYTTTLPRGIAVGRFIRRLERGNGGPGLE